MNFFNTSIEDVVLIKSITNEDDRGYFMETFRQNKLNNFLGKEIVFCQDNETKSKKGVLRGLHFQLPPFSQSKLVRVIEGEVLDVSVDIRKGSPTFGKYVSEILSGENNHQIFIPRGFAHGFLVLSDFAIFSYKVDNYYSAKHDLGIAFNDPAIGIDWNMPFDKLHISNKDLKLPNLNSLNDACEQFHYSKLLYD